VNGNRVLDFPDWMVRLGRQALVAASGDLFVFGGLSRLAFHGIQKVDPGTAPVGCGLESGRVNITMRVTGRSD
jgi:alkylated DNA repair protein (DNA oxidative demethylase)